MTAVRPNFGDLLAPGFRDIFVETSKQYPEMYTQLFNVKNSTRQYEEDSSISGFGTVPEKDEGVGIVYDDPIQGFNVRYTHRTHGLGFRVTREMWEDDQYGAMKKMPAALGRSMRITIETDAANVYNRGFNSSYAGGDGKELLATDHPLTGGGTGRNELSAAADLSETSLEQAMIDIAAITDDRGLLIAKRPVKLVVGPAFAWTAQRLLQSTLAPGSANNAVNPANGLMPYIVNPYLTDPDAWFIILDDSELNWFWRRRPDLEQGNDFDTEDAKFKVTARWSRGWSDWRSVFGSPGA